MLFLKCIGIGTLLLIGLLIVIMIAVFLVRLLEILLTKIEEINCTYKTLGNILFFLVWFVILNVALGLMIYYYAYF